MSEFEFTILIFCFTAYYFIERCLRIILIAYQPSFYEKIRASRKDLVFFGIWMGLLITAFSTPFCALGAQKAWNSWRHSSVNGKQGDEWSLDPHAKVCVASRTILWVSELNRLDMYSLYVVHHTGSIISLLSFLYFQWPPAIFFTLFTTLISEIPGDLVWMLSSYMHAGEQVSPTLSRFKYHLVRFNAFQYTLLRGAGIALVSWMLFTNSPGLQGRPLLEQTFGYTLLGLYVLFCASYVSRQSRSTPINAFESAGKETGLRQITSPALVTEKDPEARQITSYPSPHVLRLECKSSGIITIHFVRFPTIIIVPYGFFMGIGFAALILVSLTIAAPSRQDREGLSFALNLCLVSAVVFARLLSLFMEDGIAKLFASPLRTLLRPGFWLHGGLFGTTLGALLSYKLGYVKDFPMFAGGLAVGLPLYETFSRIGCHTYGCCFGKVADPATSVTSSDCATKQALWRIFPYPAVTYSHPTEYAVTRLNPKLLHVPLVPIQLISATLFLLLFLCVSLPLLYFTSLQVAGSGTLICHVAIRLITERYRADFRGEKHYRLSATGRMALVQATGAFLWLGITIMSEEGMTAPRPDWEWSSIKGRLWGSVFATILGVVVYGVHIGEVGSWTG